MKIKLRIMMGNKLMRLSDEEVLNFATLAIMELGPRWNKQEFTELTIKLQPED